MPMKNPSHPGISVRINCLEPLGLSIAEGAKVLGVTRQALNNLVSGKSGISPEMAVRLSKEYGNVLSGMRQVVLKKIENILPARSVNASELNKEHGHGFSESHQSASWQ